MVRPPVTLGLKMVAAIPSESVATVVGLNVPLPAGVTEKVTVSPDTATPLLVKVASTTTDDPLTTVAGATLVVKALVCSILSSETDLEPHPANRLTETPRITAARRQQLKIVCLNITSPVSTVVLFLKRNELSAFSLTIGSI
jgi:hypothetical protein